MKVKKNTLSNLFALVGIGYLISIVASKAGSSIWSKIELGYGNPSFNFDGLLSPTPSIAVTLPVSIQNNNNVGITVTSFVGELYYGTVKISNVSIPLTTAVPANGMVNTILAFNVEAAQLINDIMTSLQTTGTYSTLVNQLRLKGVVETSIARVNLNTVISLV
jgi:hypothetical protein